jgi:chromosome segregation ATPase
METSEILVAILSSNLLVLVVNGIFNRRRNRSEINKNLAEIDKLRFEIQEEEKLNLAEIENKVFARASLLIDDQRDEIKALKDDVARLKERHVKENARLHEQHAKKTDRLELKITNLEKHIESYRQQADSYREENEVLKGQVANLRASFRGLR